MTHLMTMSPIPTPAEDQTATVAGVRSTITKGAGSP
jgi:hypothetical protein